ncbi:MAG: hypothetical protein HOP21_04195 [Methylotenera sp.]|nr:hypothetical protein [Methylotenera sp.]
MSKTLTFALVVVGLWSVTISHAEELKLKRLQALPQVTAPAIEASQVQLPAQLQPIALPKAATTPVSATRTGLPRSKLPSATSAVAPLDAKVLNPQFFLPVEAGVKPPQTSIKPNTIQSIDLKLKPIESPTRINGGLKDLKEKVDAGRVTTFNHRITTDKIEIHGVPISQEATLGQVCVGTTVMVNGQCVERNNEAALEPLQKPEMGKILERKKEELAKPRCQQNEMMNANGQCVAS